MGWNRFLMTRDDLDVINPVYLIHQCYMRAIGRPDPENQHKVRKPVQNANDFNHTSSAVALIGTAATYSLNLMINIGS